MGATKNDPTILELIKYQKQRNLSPHFTSESEFLGDSSHWCINAINRQKMNLIGGEIVGVKTKDRKVIHIEELMEEAGLNLDYNAVGIYIPNDEILNRPKYQWFAVLPVDQVLESRMIVSKYLVSSIIDTSDEYAKTTKITSVVEI
jgi:hypothetical protein